MLKSYLCNRTQIVKNGAFISEEQNVITGIPQGTCLGPLLFIIYVNDMICKSDIDNFYQYADDTAITDTDEDLQKLKRRLEVKINNLIDWTEKNGLKINEEKSEFMIFISKQNPQYKKSREMKLKIKNISITVKETIKYLGVYLDTTLQWKEQISKTKTKITNATIVQNKKRFNRRP